MHKYFDQLGVGDRAKSRGRTITEADLVMFSAFSGDWYSLHTDREYAEGTRFGQRIAHGLLVLSVASGLVPLQSGAVVSLYGIDRLRFTAPTFIGDTIHVEMEVVAKEERGGGTGLATFRQDVVNQRGETVCTSVLKVLLNKGGGNSA